MARIRHTIGPLVCYHGCDRTIAEQVLLNKTQLKQSENEYDWLGPGTYFWVDSVERALHWANEQKKSSNSSMSNPYVVGAYVHPGLCLNLTDFGVMEELRTAYQFLVKMTEVSDVPLPKNTASLNNVFLRRSLDCAVIKTVHQLRKDGNEPEYDTVYGIFEEGKELFPGSGFREKTHVQISVTNPHAILGYFRVPYFD